MLYAPNAPTGAGLSPPRCFAPMPQNALPSVRVSETIDVDDRTRVRVWSPWYLTGPSNSGRYGRVDVFAHSSFNGVWVWVGSATPCDEGES